MTHDKLTVYFSCETCGLVDCPCTVRFRRQGEDVSWYVGQFLAKFITQVHRAKSPSCPARSIQNLKIPLPDKEGDGIGMSGGFPNGPPRMPPLPPETPAGG